METIRIRAGLIPYTLSGAIVMTMGSALLKQGLVIPAIACWALLGPIIVVAAFDRIEFDGKVIRHRGPLAFLLTHLFRIRRELPISDIEAITTETLRLSFATGDARISYHTRISGAGSEIVVRSHRSAYAPFIKALVRQVGLHKLDPRSSEIYEYFATGKALNGSPVLKSDIAAMPPTLLRRIGNALRLAGKLAQASSYFRVAYEKEPRNPQLLYEMSRFFHSSAQTEDTRLLQRSDACLRLASRLAGNEPALLERIGEAFFERTDFKRAAECFHRALALDPECFRANIGLAEIALRDGKLAHVAHFYNAAASSRDVALARMAGREARYYERLMEDDDFLEGELRRIKISNQIRWARRLAATTFFSAWLVGGIVGRFSQLIEQFGWAIMAASGILWLALMCTTRFFRRRQA
ncbi:MAG TPA: tetratricopeptide repeat protein [Blastocatellia bacterium]|nr:tetratricopeptide repeat protein [Blastocatellia bacterium]